MPAPVVPVRSAAPGSPAREEQAPQGCAAYKNLRPMRRLEGAGHSEGTSPDYDRQSHRDTTPKSARGGEPPPARGRGGPAPSRIACRQEFRMQSMQEENAEQARPPAAAPVDTAGT